jgi:UDP-galactopyranose mutase
MIQTPKIVEANLQQFAKTPNSKVLNYMIINKFLSVEIYCHKKLLIINERAIMIKINLFKIKLKT